MNGWPEFSDGYAAPILWGVREGYTIAEISAGLDVEPWVVVQVIEARSAVRFPAAARLPVPTRVTAAPKVPALPADVFRAPSRRRAPMLLDVPAKIDPTRTDAVYLAWAKSRRGASQLLELHG